MAVSGQSRWSSSSVLRGRKTRGIAEPPEEPDVGYPQGLDATAFGTFPDDDQFLLRHRSKRLGDQIDALVRSELRYRHVFRTATEFCVYRVDRHWRIDDR